MRAMDGLCAFGYRVPGGARLNEQVKDVASRHIHLVGSDRAAAHALPPQARRVGKGCEL